MVMIIFRTYSCLHATVLQSQSGQLAPSLKYPKAWHVLKGLIDRAHKKSATARISLRVNRVFFSN